MTKIFALVFILIISSCSNHRKNKMDKEDVSTTYQLTRHFSVSEDKLFNAFINESILKKIWGVSSISVDAREGGNANAKMEIEGQNWNFTITYKDIVPNKKLSWAVRFERFPEKEIIVTLSFKPIAEGTELTLDMENFASPRERDENRKAWLASLTVLEKIMNQ